MKSQRNRENQNKGSIDKQDTNSRKTKSIHPDIKSDRNCNQQKLASQKDEIVKMTNKQRQTQKSRKNYSVKDSKYNSVVEHNSIKNGVRHIQEIDGKTELNKARSKRKDKELEDELEQQQLLRSGIANSKNDKKVKFGVQRRQIILHDILHPPINIKDNKSEKKDFKISQTESQRIEDNQYDQIVNEIKLNNFQSKVIPQEVTHIKKEQTFLAKITQSQSQVMASPLNFQKTNDFNSQTQSPSACSKSQQVPSKSLRKQQDHQQRCIHHQLLKMDSIQEQAINQSVEKTFKNQQQGIIRHEYANSKDQHHIHINIQPCQSEISEDRHTQKKSNKIQQNKIIITTKISNNLIDNSKDGRKGPKQVNKLALVNGIFEEKVNTKFQKEFKEQQERKILNDEINYLKQAVRELKLEKIKAKAELSMTIEANPYRPPAEQRKSRYQTLNASISEKQSEESAAPIFGKIRKNRSLSKKNASYSLKSQNLTQQKELDLPAPIININKLPQRTNPTMSYTTQRKNPYSQIQFAKEYKTMNLERIAEQNLEQSMRFQGNLTTSHQLPVYGSHLRSNRINMRGPEICNDVLSKFESSDKKFKKFIHLSSARSRTHTNSSRVSQGQRIPAFKNPQISKQQSQQFQSQQNNQFQGVIIKNSYLQPTISLNKKYQIPNRSELKVNQQIKQGQKINLSKRKKNFKVNSIPEIPPNPVYSTSNEDLMDLISQILPFSNIKYSQKDLEDCILKKYKNCIMFELKRFPLIKVVWYFNSKLYIGQWDTIKNERNGFGKQFSKEKYYYQGNFVSSKRHGNGIFINESSCYEGQWSNGQKEGRGRYSDLNEEIYYEGEWKDSKRHGKGHYEYEGNIYEGNFANNIKSGFGVQLFKNGDRYIGNYHNGKFQGEGKYIWFNHSYYLGSFHEGYRQGSGKWQSGSQNYELYIGQFIRDKKQGTGKYIWNNRCVYEGSFFNDLKHGLGSILYPDGRYMEGVWTQGILTDVLNKVTEANKQEPLEQPRSRTLQSRTILRVIDNPF